MTEYDVLQESYTPPTLPARSGEISEIQHQIEIFERNRMCNNLLIDGVSGSGKTTTMKYLRGKYPHAMFYTNAQRVQDSVLSLMNQITDAKAKTYDRALNNVIDHLSHNRKILVIDEIDKMSKQPKMWFYINEIFRETSIPLFIVTNKKQYVNTLPYDVRTTLLFRNTLFPAYTAEQLSEIILQRISLCGYSFKDNAKTSLKIARVSHDYGARMAINLLRTLILDDIRNPTLKNIEEARKKIDEEELSRTIHRMTHTEQQILFHIADLTLNGDEKNLTTGSITESFPNTSRVWVSQTLTSLNDYDYIQTKAISVKKRGRTRRILMERGLAGQICQIRDNTKPSNMSENNHLKQTTLAATSL